MRLATFNVENLFDRAKAMNLGDWQAGKPILESFAKLNQLLGESNYTASRKTRMVQLMTELGLDKADMAKFVVLRKNKGKLLQRSKTTGLTITADGRADWTGSLELREEPTDEVSMRNTARVIMELQADILAVVEVESRPVLSAFNEQIIAALGGTPMSHVMVIDGNDERGIDVGIMSGLAYPIGRMQSHVDDKDNKGNRIFSRDCPVYEFAVAGEPLYVLVNHFKSKGFGSTATSNARRHAQATRVKQIYEQLRHAGMERIAIVGDLNDTPNSSTLAPLLMQTDLKDVAQHNNFDDGGYAGTFGLCNASNKIDFILLSPALFSKVQAGGAFRKGLWPGVKPKRWDTFDELTSPSHAASDHAALWVDLDI